ncbi:MAG: dipeptide/oligopeptide/nickel ABC transporter ATP-binding protein [Nocardioides sp.]|uniref:ATP-binding cassette domain-containing protein n=1 Tax=Nocardioides sp. TaxID=35761 RepID=UPI0039E697EB
MSEADAPLLSISDLVVEYRRGRRLPVRAVDGVSLEVGHNEVLGLVGESGSGKSTIARAIQGLVPVTTGLITIGGEPLRARTRHERRRLAAHVQTVFQDPYGSLNPARSVGASIAEPLRVQQRHLSRDQVRTRVADELSRVGLDRDVATLAPGRLSGGQRQRVAIARALITRPALVICDEAVSALDLSIQAQILNLLADIKDELGTSYLFITHDLGVVRQIADRVAVQQSGRLVELFDAEEVDSPLRAPYTRRLFNAAPIPDPLRQTEKRARFERYEEGQQVRTA